MAAQRDCVVLTVLIFTIFLVSPQFVEAARVMKGDQWEKKKQEFSFVLPVQLLQRGPVAPSGPNPCTNIPGQSTGRCTLQTMNVAATVARASPSTRGTPQSS